MVAISTQEVLVAPDTVPLEAIVRPRRRLTVSAAAAVGICDLVVIAAAFGGLGLHVLAPFGVLCMLFIACSGGYRMSFRARVSERLPTLAASVAVAAMITSALIGASTSLSRRALVVVVGCFFVRLVGAMIARRARTRYTTSADAVIIGAGTVGQALAERMGSHPEFGLRLMGFVDDIDEDLPYPLLGSTRNLGAILEVYRPRVLIIAFGAMRESDLVPVVRACERQDVEVYMVPRLFELGVTTAADDDLWGIPLHHVRRAALRPAAWRTKRAFDIALASVFGVLVLPLFAVLALAVRLSSPGPIFYRQQRIGQRGRPFDILKFRSMLVNDDGVSTWDVTQDHRVTRLGRFLRVTSLDELPQLINVLRGDMSLVGPRPERPLFVEEFSASVRNYADRHRVPVGITGLAQINGLRGATSIEERAFFDNLYIEHWSLWTDLLILGRTLLAVLRPPASIQVQTPAGDVIDLRDRHDMPAMLDEVAADGRS